VHNVERIYLNFDSQKEGAAELKEYFLKNYDDIEAKILDFNGQELNEVFVGICMVMSALGGPSGIKELWRLIIKMANQHKDKIKIDDGEVNISDMSIKEFIELYEEYKKTHK
jgi:hypothetical protein